MSSVLRSLSVVLIATLLLAVPHKFSMLGKGVARDHALIARTERRGRNANVLLLAAIAVEIAISIALLVTPIVGFAASAGLLLFYARELSTQEPFKDCDCYGELLPSSIRYALVRDLVLGCAAVAGFVLLAAGVVQVVPLSIAVLLPAVLLVSGVLAAAAARRAGGYQVNPTKPST